MQLDDDEFAREPLDSAQPAAQGGKRWTGGIFGALYKPLRQRFARRVLLTIGACILLAITVLVSTGTAGTLWRQARFSWLEHNAPMLTRTTLTSRPAGQRTLPSGWQQQPQVTLPNPNVHWYIPAPNDPQTLYACSAGQANAKGYLEDGTLIFWYSHDSGQHWSSVPMPPAQAASCYVTVAPDAPERVGLMSQYLGLVRAQDVACSQLAAFLSADGGAHWHTVPSLPDTPIEAGWNTNCSVSLWPGARHLYLLYQYSAPSGSSSNGTETYGSSLVRSDDGGQTWKRLDENRPPESGAYFYPTLLDDGETLLLNVNHYESPVSGKPYHEETWLWVSHDAGDNWEPLGKVDGYGTLKMLLAPEAHSATPSLAHPLYLLDEAYPSSLRFRTQIAQVTDLHHWAPLPPLPIAGTTPERLGITSVLAETASGKLLVFGLGPNDHVHSDDALQSSSFKPAQQWLWEWDPQASRWTLLTPALNSPWPKECNEGCWQGWLTPSQGSVDMGTYLWVTGYFPNEQVQWKTFSILLPDPL